MKTESETKKMKRIKICLQLKQAIGRASDSPKKNPSKISTNNGKMNEREWDFDCHHHINLVLWLFQFLFFTPFCRILVRIKREKN